jgi:hypothetical protein
LCSELFSYYFHYPHMNSPESCITALLSVRILRHITTPSNLQNIFQCEGSRRAWLSRTGTAVLLRSGIGGSLRGL